MAIDFSETILFEGDFEISELRKENHKFSTLNIFLITFLIISTIVISNEINSRKEQVKIIK